MPDGAGDTVFADASAGRYREAGVDGSQYHGPESTTTGILTGLGIAFKVSLRKRALIGAMKKEIPYLHQCKRLRCAEETAINVR